MHYLVSTKNSFFDLLNKTAIFDVQKYEQNGDEKLSQTLFICEVCCESHLIVPELIFENKYFETSAVFLCFMSFDSK